MIRFSFVEPSYLLAVGLILLCTFLVVGSDLGLQAPALLVGLIWALHLSMGLSAIRFAIVNLSRWRVTVGWPDLMLLSMAGLFASLVLAPLSFGIDQWLLSLGVDTDDYSLVGRSPWSPAIPVAIFEEWTHVVGPTLLVAMLLVVPAWWARWRVVLSNASG